MINRLGVMRLALQGLSDHCDHLRETAGRYYGKDEKLYNQFIEELCTAKEQWLELFEALHSTPCVDFGFMLVTEYDLYDYAVLALIPMRPDGTKPSKLEQELINIREKIAEEEVSEEFKAYAVENDMQWRIRESVDGYVAELGTQYDRGFRSYEAARFDTCAEAEQFINRKRSANEA